MRIFFTILALWCLQGHLQQASAQTVSPPVSSVRQQPADRVDALIPAPASVKRLSAASVKVGKVDKRLDSRLKLPTNEAYTLRISGGKALLRAKTPQGLVWAQRTLEQLTDARGFAPQVYIEDYPAFPFRGFMHDTGRNFVEVDMIKAHIELMSRYKLNAFHWHLTDNPAWRIECKAYPQLNDARYQRKGRDEGRFYTYAQIREVIAFARERGVQVVPEIDMPGHSKFFNDTFGFSMDSAEGMKVLEKCLAEFFAEIPASDCPYFHIGSDEVHIKEPKAFMQWAEALAAKYGRQAIAWDPGLPSAPTTIRQIWNEAEGSNTAATDKPGRYLDSFMGYLNYYDPQVYTSKMFLHRPCGVDKADARAMGGILCLWNDVRVADKERLALHNGMLNGMLPFAERFWKGGHVGHELDGCLTPAPDSPAGKALSAFEGRLAFHRDQLLKGQPLRWAGASELEWTIVGPSARGTAPADMPRRKAWGGVVEMDAFCKQHKVALLPTMDAWAETRLQVDRDTVITAWVGYEVAARSNRISDGIGRQGHWENDGRIWVNGQEVFPAQAWQEPGKYRYHYHTWHRPEEEQPYTDEQFYWMRKPVQLQLKQGANHIRLFIPRVFGGQRWSFAFVPVQEQEGGVKEASGVRFLKGEGL